MMYKKLLFISIIIVIVSGSVAGINAYNFPGAVFIPPSEQRSGDAAKGYEYLVTGDYIKSGIGYGYFSFLNPKDQNNLLGRTGKNAVTPYNFNVVKSENKIDIVVPNCLQCHAQMFEGKLYVGLGNTILDFSQPIKSNDIRGRIAKGIMETFSPRQYEAAQILLRSYSTLGPGLKTEVQGVNAADRLAGLLAAHRDPVTLEWRDEPLLEIPDEVIPTDVPAWWLLKKKNGMFYTGFGRGDFTKFIMLSDLLTVKDTVEARETYSHFGDVLAYLKTIEPPKYSHSINQNLVSEGEVVFNNTCSKCHGTYGKDGIYPNLLISENIIKTDSMLYKSNYQNAQFIDWFNKSWYAQGDHSAKLQPFNGYIAPPLDGVWITAPYLHNSSVPTLETLLNSKERPRYWQRDFKHPQYDYEKVGWKYEEKSKPDKKTYNTDLPGYNNGGHLFGDNLTDGERKAVIEYLKTL